MKLFADHSKPSVVLFSYFVLNCVRHTLTLIPSAPPTLPSLQGCTAALTSSVQVNNIGYIVGGFGVAFGIFEVQYIYFCVQLT